MAFTNNSRQLGDGVESPYRNDSKPERENKHFRDELWSPTDLDEMVTWSDRSRTIFSRGKEEEEQHSARSNQLQEQGAQGWVGSSVLRDLVFTLCMVPG